MENSWKVLLKTFFFFRRQAARRKPPSAHTLCGKLLEGSSQKVFLLKEVGSTQLASQCAHTLWATPGKLFPKSFSSSGCGQHAGPLPVRTHSVGNSWKVLENAGSTQDPSQCAHTLWETPGKFLRMQAARRTPPSAHTPWKTPEKFFSKCFSSSRSRQHAVSIQVLTYFFRRQASCRTPPSAHTLCGKLLEGSSQKVFLLKEVGSEQ